MEPVTTAYQQQPRGGIYPRELQKRTDGERKSFECQEASDERENDLRRFDSESSPQRIPFRRGHRLEACEIAAHAESRQRLDARARRGGAQPSTVVVAQHPDFVEPLRRPCLAG